MAFKKLASLKIENPEISVDTWVSNTRGNIKTASNKVLEYKKVLSDFDPENYLLTHCTIVASVDVEDAPTPLKFRSEKTKKEYEKLAGRKDFFITPETSKYMNANGDAWTRELLKASYKTFVGAENYVEHVQDPALSKGKILDAAIREVDDGKSLFVDILVATNKKHKDLVDKIKTGKLTTLSMGSVVAFTVCTRCGNVAADETELCTDIQFLKRSHFISENDGKKRITAELCGHFLYPESNHFIEGSWVETPAFKGAVMRNEIVLGNQKEAFAEKLANALNIKSPELKETASRIISAFCLVDKIRSFTAKTDPIEIKDPTFPEGVDVPEELKDEEPDKEEKPVEEIKEKPAEEAPKEEKPIEEEPKTEEKPVEEPPKDTPAEEPVPEELKQMGEPPAEPPKEEVPEEVIEEESKKPFDTIKEDIKKNIKDQIKKELLKDLGIDFGEPGTTNVNNVNLNDSLVKSNLTLLKKASKIIKESGFRTLKKEGFSKSDMLKIAYLSNKYSINKDIYKIVSSLNFNDFSTFRRIAKKVEGVLGRGLEEKERQALDKLIKEII